MWDKDVEQTEDMVLLNGPPLASATTKLLGPVKMKDHAH